MGSNEDWQCVINEFKYLANNDQRVGAMAQVILDLRAILAKKRLTMEETELIQRSLALAKHMLDDTGPPDDLIEDVGYVVDPEMDMTHSDRMLTLHNLIEDIRRKI